MCDFKLSVLSGLREKQFALSVVKKHRQRALSVDYQNAFPAIHRQKQKCARMPPQNHRQRALLVNQPHMLPRLAYGIHRQRLLSVGAGVPCVRMRVGSWSDSAAPPRLSPAASSSGGR